MSTVFRHQSQLLSSPEVGKFQFGDTECYRGLVWMVLKQGGRLQPLLPSLLLPSVLCAPGTPASSCRVACRPVPVVTPHIRTTPHHVEGASQETQHRDLITLQWLCLSRTLSYLWASRS